MLFLSITIYLKYYVVNNYNLLLLDKLNFIILGNFIHCGIMAFSALTISCIVLLTDAWHIQDKKS